VPADNSVFRRLRLLSEPAGDFPFGEARPVTEVLTLEQAVRFQFRRPPARAEASHLTPGSLPHPAKFATGPANPGAARPRLECSPPVVIWGGETVEIQFFAGSCDFFCKRASEAAQGMHYF
jgi:hypothetical protein